MRRCASVLTRTRLPGLRFSTIRQSPVCACTLAAKNNTEMAQTTICLFRPEGNAARRTLHAVRKTLRNSPRLIAFLPVSGMGAFCGPLERKKRGPVAGGLPFAVFKGWVFLLSFPNYEFLISSFY